MVERGGLENRCTRERTVGSNPTPSAIHLSQIIDLYYVFTMSQQLCPSICLKNSRHGSHLASSPAAALQSRSVSSSDPKGDAVHDLGEKCGLKRCRFARLCFKAVHSGLCRSKVVQSGPRWSETGGPKWPKVAQSGPSRRRLEAAGRAPGHAPAPRRRSGPAFPEGRRSCALHPQSLPPPAGPVHRTIVIGTMPLIIPCTIRRTN